MLSPAARLWGLKRNSVRSTGYRVQDPLSHHSHATRSFCKCSAPTSFPSTQVLSCTTSRRSSTPYRATHTYLLKLSIEFISVAILLVSNIDECLSTLAAVCVTLRFVNWYPDEICASLYLVLGQRLRFYERFAKALDYYMCVHSGLSLWDHYTMLHSHSSWTFFAICIRVLAHGVCDSVARCVLIVAVVFWLIFCHRYVDHHLWHCT